MAFRGCCPFARSLIPKEKDSKDKEETYKLNPAFKRLVITAKNSNRAVSDMLKIDDSYLSFCIDETADYLYQKLIEEVKNNYQNGIDADNKKSKSNNNLSDNELLLSLSTPKRK